MYRVYGDAISGNCYKVKLIMNELALPFVWVDVDILAGDTRRPEFLEKNPNGRVPVLEIEGQGCLAESNAILAYLGEGTPLVPRDAYQRALVWQWLFFEQYSHEPYIATSRFIVRYLGRPAEREEELRVRSAPGYRALDVMERRLEIGEFIVGDHFTLADIALFAYTHVAEEGGFSLARYPAIRAWIDRVAARPAFLPMYETPGVS
ncbi:MAG: glutathione S-transferase family protein [Gammaproteobacteria bacterium]